jgi:REP element-mobilizing transposase RayT
MPRKYRKVLVDWQAPYIQSLMRLVETQSKVTIANWCLDYDVLWGVGCGV